MIVKEQVAAWRAKPTAVLERDSQGRALRTRTGKDRQPFLAEMAATAPDPADLRSSHLRAPVATPVFGRRSVVHRVGQPAYRAFDRPQPHCQRGAPSAIVVSLHRVVVGAAVGIGVGSLLGLAAGLTKLGEDLVDSTMQMLRTVPFVGLIPLLIVWFGIGETPKYAIIALGTAFPVYLNVFAGIRNVDASLLECAETLGVSRLGLVRHVVLPAALPNAFVGLRYALGIAWIALIFAEQVNASSGIGYLMNNAEQYDQTNSSSFVLRCTPCWACASICWSAFSSATCSPGAPPSVADEFSC